ncbi:MAG: porin family protein, partial [Bacteroidota bacterium]
YGLDKIKIPRPPADIGLFDVLRTAPHGGAYVTYRLPARLGSEYLARVVSQLSLCTELVFSNVGFVYKGYGLKLSYFNIPLLFVYNLHGTSYGFRFCLGPQVEFMWRARPINSFFLEERDFNPIAWSIVGGVQYAFAVGINLDMRHNWGLTDITYPHGFVQALKMMEGTWITNQYLQLSISVDAATIYQQLQSINKRMDKKLLKRSTGWRLPKRTSASLQLSDANSSSIKSVGVSCSSLPQ